MTAKEIQEAARNKKISDGEFIKLFQTYLSGHKSMGALLGLMHVLKTHRPLIFKEICRTIVNKVQRLKKTDRSLS